ncbi:MAG TPA: glycosyltransferase family 87 protein [Tepidisphaeraceae bacterium]|nr:glycosyltransferase family 87 protein [Tepidisphaeraceae bacterium]
MGLSAMAARLAKAFLILLAVGLLAFNFVRIIQKPIGDFHNHWLLGYNLLHGHSLYLGRGAQTPAERNPYPPFWALAHAPLTVVSAHQAQIIGFLPMYLGALGLLLWTLTRLTRPHFPIVNSAARFWILAIPMLVALRFLSRDLSECGANIGLVALAWFAIYSWTRDRDWLAGASLGLAIALKMTAGLFLPYFLWKRQWKMALATIAFAAAFSLSPVLVRGPTRFANDLREWSAVVRAGHTGNPLIGVLGAATTNNFSLRPALGRLLMKSPTDPENPVSPKLLDLPPRAASIIVDAIELSLLIAFAWIVRRPVTDRHDLTILYECAAVSLLILLLSPITWGHHCVGTLPALVLIFLTGLSYRGLPRWMLVLVAYILLTLLLNRAFIGKDLSLLVSNFSPVTWEIVCLLALTLGCGALVLSAPRAVDIHRQANPAASDPMPHPQHHFEA